MSDNPLNPMESKKKPKKYAEIETCLEYARGIVRNLKKERGKIIKNIS